LHHHTSHTSASTTPGGQGEGDRIKFELNAGILLLKAQSVRKPPLKQFLSAHLNGCRQTLLAQRSVWLQIRHCMLF
jgi:hypothetical protein